jgi:Methyltransferase domain
VTSPQPCAVARAVYVAEVLATYNRRPGGRNERRGADGRVVLLNLGCGAPDRPSRHPLPGFVNLDRHTTGWTWESGLTDLAAASVEAITVSHSLYVVTEEYWPATFSEMYRVLKPGGVLRVTEDDAVNAAGPRRRGGWKGSEPFAPVTSAAHMLGHMRRAGFEATHEVGPSSSLYTGPLSLCQRWHGDPPDVFFVEGVKA